MKLEDYTYIHGRKIKYLKEQVNFFNSELKEEKLFFKFIEKSGIQFDDIVPYNFNNKSGAIIYTRDYSLLDSFRRVKINEVTCAPYEINALSFGIDKEKIEFYSKIKVENTELNNFEIILRDYDMILRDYEEILEGKCDWEFGYDKKLNEKYLSEIKERIKYFEEKGMNKKLLKNVGEYLNWFAQGLNPEDDNRR